MNTKIFKTLTYAALVAGLASCGNTDDLLQVSTNIQMPLSTGTCADAKYLEEARAWDVSTYDPAYEGIGRIELTASGNYMFLPKMGDITFEDIDDEMDYAPSRNSRADNGFEIISKKQTSPFKRMSKSASTRAYAQFPAGTFTKISDNEYDLSSAGTLIINADGTLTLNDGKEVCKFDATPVNAYELDALTRRFSRTWEIVQVERAYYDSNGKIVKKRILSQQEIEDDYVRAVVVTQYGAFMRYEWDKSFEDYGMWRWEIPSKQFFQFAFREYDPYSYNTWTEYGLEQVFFYDDFAMYLEYGDYDEGGVYYDTVDVLKTRATNDFDF